MGLAEDNYYVLTQYLGTGRKPTKKEYERSKKHRIPQEWSAGQSQNWWVLGVGVRVAYGDKSERPQVIRRLEYEKGVIGCWGSEQFSPNYWAFHLVGRMTIRKNIPDTGGVLTSLIDEQVKQIRLYCDIAFSPDGKEILWAGQRGTCEAEFSSYEFWYLYEKYAIGNNPKPKAFWKKQKDRYGWIQDPWVANYLRNSFNNTFGHMRIMVPLHMLLFDGGSKLVYVERCVHGSTEMRGASGVINGQKISAPANYATRYRGKGVSGKMHVVTTSNGLQVVYSGPYNDLFNRNPMVYDGPVGRLVSHSVWDQSGIRVMYLDPANSSVAPQSSPDGGSDTPQEKGGFWKTLLERAKNFFTPE
jgi:hypothetical protein